MAAGSELTGGTKLPDVILSLSPLTGRSGDSGSGPGTITAVVTVRADSADGPGLPEPTGTVTFTSGGRVACAAVALQAGRASCAMTVSPQTYVAAFYSGDGTYVGRGSYAEVG